MFRLSSDSPGATARRRAGALVLVALVVAAHIALVGWVVPAWLDHDATPSIAPTLQVRSVALLPVAAAAAVPATAPLHVPAPPPPPPRSPPKSGPPSALVAAHPASPSPSEPTGEAPRPASVGAELVAEAFGDAASARWQDVPVYAPRLPAAGQWRYRLQRGAVLADATLTWEPQSDGRYEARLEGRVAGLTMLDWVSRGTIDASGIAPERFALRRRGRDQQAANFQRDAGKITFSGPTHEFPLLPGAQDRLSWMLQLRGIVDAEPSRYGPGAKVVLMVVGARGGGDVWTFHVQSLDTLGGRPALKLVREARRAYDTRAEVWLDPERAHLPLRAVLAQAEGGPALVLDLEP
jgi:hypothetical protein